MRQLGSISEANILTDFNVNSTMKDYNSTDLVELGNSTNFYNDTDNINLTHNSNLTEFNGITDYFNSSYISTVTRSTFTMILTISTPPISMGTQPMSTLRTMIT